MSTNYATVQTVPSAYITKNKQRIKQHEGTVYLQNGETFEIELYNPTQDDILAKIDLNQKSISGGGIVLRPGERVFLERYLDDAKQFKFETYQVDDNFEGEMATMKNGWVTVTFHNEVLKPKYSPYNTGTIIYNNTNPTQDWHTYYNHTGSPVFRGNTTTSGDITFNTTSMNVSNFVDIGDTTNVRGLLNDSKQVETGKIEKGGKSNQKFQSVDKEFATFSFHNVEWRILPKSRQPLTSQDLNKRYCTECGSTIKKSTFKFCPHCGNKVVD
jgi:hypothetical protein